MSAARQTGKKSNKSIAVLIGIVAVLILGYMVIKGVAGETGSTAAAGADLVIPKSEVTEKVKFYPYKVGKTAMEVMAVKASDGTIRTALNTCQVCNGSPRAYYEQEGNVVVCQNCGNQFAMDMIEKERGGCNPIPILKENKVEDDANITVSKDFLAQAEPLFKTWKTNK